MLGVDFFGCLLPAQPRRVLDCWESPPRSQSLKNWRPLKRVLSLWKGDQGLQKLGSVQSRPFVPLMGKPSLGKRGPCPDHSAGGCQSELRGDHLPPTPTPHWAFSAFTTPCISAPHPQRMLRLSEIGQWTGFEPSWWAHQLILLPHPGPCTCSSYTWML